MGSRKGNTFSTATFTVAEEGPSWEELMPEAMAAARERQALGDLRFVVEGSRQRKQARGRSFPFSERSFPPRLALSSDS